MELNKGVLLLMTLVLVLVIGTFTAYSQNLPDLTVTDINFTQASNCVSLTGNVTVNVTMFVKNIGNATAFNFTDRIEIGNHEHIFNFFVPSLTSGSTTNHVGSISRRCFVEFTANATADIFRQVTESNEANNNRVETYTPT